MREWAREFAVFFPAGLVALWLFWVPERLSWAWLVPGALLFGAAFATANELWNRPREFLRDVRRLGGRVARRSA